MHILRLWTEYKRYSFWDALWNWSPRLRRIAICHESNQNCPVAKYLRFVSITVLRPMKIFLKLNLMSVCIEAIFVTNFVFDLLCVFITFPAFRLETEKTAKCKKKT